LCTLLRFRNRGRLLVERGSFPWRREKICLACASQNHTHNNHTHNKALGTQEARAAACATRRAGARVPHDARDIAPSPGRTGELPAGASAALARRPQTRIP
jgi:hypothetical protein